MAPTFTFFACFACRKSREADVLRELLGDDDAGVIHRDRVRMG